MKQQRIKLSVSLLSAVFLIGIFSGCEKQLRLDKPASGPIEVFEEVWTIIDQRYALFPVKNVDWNAIHQQFRSQIKEDMSLKKLFVTVASMLETLEDGHVSLISNTDTATYENFYKPFARNFNYNNVVVNYLGNEYQTAGPLVYTMKENVGYLYYSSFNRDITDEQLDSAFKDLQAGKGLIVDVRGNTGGASVNAAKLFSRFITEKKLVRFDQQKNGTGHGDFLAPVPTYISPASSFIYSKPVALLTNRSCFSSCNDFVLYMSNLPAVTVFGDQTGGGGGLPEIYLLVNGWRLQYTATETLSPLKESIEKGIQPDINIGINSIDDSNGKDPILENAFQSLQ